MKILHIIPSLSIGGAERLVVDICNELNRRDDAEVKLLVLSDRIEFDEKSIEFDLNIINSQLTLYQKILKNTFQKYCQKHLKKIFFC